MEGSSSLSDISNTLLLGSIAPVAGHCSNRVIDMQKAAALLC